MKQLIGKVAAQAAITLMTAATLPVVAQTPPDAGSILKEVPDPPSRAPRPIPTLPAGELEPPMQALPGGPTVAVRDYSIVGNRVIDQTTLRQLIREDVNKTLTLPELEAVAFQITRFYREQGYFVARAYIPQQEVVDGQVTIRVVEGNYGEFHLKNSSLVRDSTLQGILDHIKPYDIVSLKTLERAMLIINDTPGAAVVRADVMPGQRVGTSDFAIDAVATSKYEGFVALDNYGSIYTGEYRLSGAFDWNSPTGQGDRLSLFGLASDKGDLLSGQLSYSMLLRPNGWRGSIALSQTNYELGDFYEALDARGTAQSLDLGLTYPIHRTRASTLEFGTNLALRDLTDEIRSVDSETDKSLLSLAPYLRWRDERKFLGYHGLTQISVTATVGKLDIETEEARALDQDEAGPRTHGSFEKINLDMSRLTLLPRDFSLLALVRGQAALGDKNLDGSERMAVSGPGGVMAYPSGELLGRNAVLVRLEAAKRLPFESMKQQVSVFANWSRAQPSTLERYRRLTDVGSAGRRNMMAGSRKHIWRAGWTMTKRAQNRRTETIFSHKLERCFSHLIFIGSEGRVNVVR
ncbi:MAG: hypothetical protein NVV73_07370 [Cellvibrionaceae bacterium]|nr:hypothetical protein [Cellvibrionaceae bacterium]